MISISVCMIVKNEERLIDRCLSCLKEIADEIIIVDTGSTDNTLEIVKKYTDKIYTFEWIDDFSAARNFSIEQATMDYIYVADADEIIDEENQLEFKKLKEVLLPEIDIVQMLYTNQLEHCTTYNFDEEYRPKLFKRLRSFSFVDPIHETLSLEPVIYDSNIRIIHKPDSNHGKRDFSIFKRVIKEGKFLSSKLIDMYARELFITGGDKDFLDAFDYFVSVTEDERRTVDEIKKAQCVIVKAARLKNDQFNFFKNAMKHIIDSPSSEVCFELGEYYFEKKDYKEAIIWYYNTLYETISEFTNKVQGVMTLDKLVACYEALGDKENADYYRNR